MRILVVDDEQLITDTICAILNECGFDAVGAYSGAEALEAAAIYQPQIVLTDVMMPRMSGVELGIQLRNLYPQTKSSFFQVRRRLQECFSARKQTVIDWTSSPSRSIQET
jgi:two-component system OmpR family response regulator